MRTGRVNVTERKGGAAMSGRWPGIGEPVWPQALAGGRAPDFALAIEWHGSGTAVLVLAGELDLYRAPDIEHALAEVIGGEPDGDRSEPTIDGRREDGGQSAGEDVRRLSVDLRWVTFIDSTTLLLLLAASRRQHGRGGELLVLVGPQTPMTVFEVTGFDRLLAIRRVDDEPKESAA